MNVMFYSTKSFDKDFFEEANRRHGHEIKYIKASLDERTAELAKDCDAICIFVNDEAPRPVLEKLAEHGVRLLALRSAGFNQVDVEAAGELGLTVARVPAYSPQAVAEHTVGLMLALNRKIYRAYARVREGDFSLHGLIGFDMHGKTVGIIGTGKIGVATAQILKGFGCKLLGFDPYPNDECRELGMEYVELNDLLSRSEIVTIHCPLTKATHHLIDADAVNRMKQGVMLINTSRGAIVDTQAVIDGLKSRQIGSMGLDVYEEEEELFFKDLSDQIIDDDVFARLLTFPNVVVTAHQAFLTKEALQSIANITLNNISGFEKNEIPEKNLVTPAMVVA